MNKYKNYTKEQLVSKIKELESKKFGLVWDDEKEPEKVVQECLNNIPILTKDITKAIHTDSRDVNNILIEGDNYHALQVLNYTHKGKVDVIYIDPPYNKGNKDFIYNDHFVDKDDGYRHSKWLNFMDKRLRLAHNLLKDDGIIFISIGKEELNQLALLVKDIFSEGNFLDVIPREQKAGSNLGDFFSPQLDYVVVATKNKTNLKGFLVDSDKKKTAKSLYQSSLTDLRPNQKYFIECPDGSKIIPPCTILDEVQREGDKRWWWSKKRYLKDKDTLIFRKTPNSPLLDENGNQSIWNVYVPPKSSNENTFTPRDYIFGLTNNKGSQILKDMKLSFNNPKPTELIEYLINITRKGNDITILDFFAGSGTTAHAVFNLNNTDNGSRQFIICTNNEGNICSGVTYPRIRNVIKGYKYSGDDKTILMSKKITFSTLYKNIKQKKNEMDEEYLSRKVKTQNQNVEKIWREIDDVILGNLDIYDDVKKEVKEGEVIVTGIKTINAYRDGIGGNLEYYQTDLVPINDLQTITDTQREELTLKAGNMVAIKENALTEVESNEYYQIFKCKRTNRHAAIYFSEDLSSFDELIKKLQKNKTTLYIYSYGKIDKSTYAYLGDNFTVEDIPKPIIDIYKEINKEAQL